MFFVILIIDIYLLVIIRIDNGADQSSSSKAVLDVNEILMISDIKQNFTSISYKFNK